MRIAVCTTGTTGDHRPLMTIALELARRGHDVEAIVHSSFASQAAGFPFPTHFVGSRPTARPEFFHPRTGFFEVARQLVIPEAADLFHRLETLTSLRPLDMVVTHHIALGAAWWAESRGTRLAIAYLSPAALFRPDGRGSMIPGFTRATPRPLAWIVRATAPRLFRKELDSTANAVRASLGLEPQRDTVLRWLESHHTHMGLWDAAFRQPTAGDPPGLATCGFQFIDAYGAEPVLSAEVASFLEGEPTPIVCALGSTAGDLPLPLSDLVVDACEHAGLRALVIGDRAPERLGQSLWVPHTPHSAVFKSAAAVVHHAGMGTLAEVLRAGKASLALPLANDQFDNAVRLRGLGIAEVSNPRSATAAALGRSLRRLLRREKMAHKAATIGAAVRESNGAARAADVILGS